MLQNTTAESDLASPYHSMHTFISAGHEALCTFLIGLKVSCLRKPLLISISALPAMPFLPHIGLLRRWRKGFMHDDERRDWLCWHVFGLDAGFYWPWGACVLFSRKMTILRAAEMPPPAFIFTIKMPAGDRRDKLAMMRR